MKRIKKYPVLSATLAFAASITPLCALGAMPLSHGAVMLVLWQVLMHCRSRQMGVLFDFGLSPAQTREFEEIMAEFKGQGKTLRELPERLRTLETENDNLRGEIKKIRRAQAGGSIGSTGIRWIGGQAFVPDDIAQALTAEFVMGLSEEKNALERAFPDRDKRKRIVEHARGLLGVNTKTALDSTTTPLPTIYAPTIVELVWHYGQARQHGTVFPLGAGTVKLPRLQAGEDTFGYLGAGTAGMSQSVPEKRVTAQLVTFTANKLGGLVRIPTEIEEDTFIPIGQFLARYIARQFAKLEDSTMFLGDGTSTYASITGVGPYCVANTTYLHQLATGKTKPTDSALSDFRALRSLVNPAVYGNNPAYYMNPSMEAQLVGFNTLGAPLVYQPASGSRPATLDGFPIYWVGVMQPYSVLTAPSTFLAFFGDLSYWYLGERGAPRVEMSREVYFATDELCMRALERIDVEAMAIDAMATLQTAAS